MKTAEEINKLVKERFDKPFWEIPDDEWNAFVEEIKKAEKNNDFNNDLKEIAEMECD